MNILNTKKGIDIFFNYVYFSNNSLLRLRILNSRDIMFLLPYAYFNYSVLFLRLSTIFYKSQLLDLFSYELPQVSSRKFVFNKKNKQVLVLNFFIQNYSSYLYLFFLSESFLSSRVNDSSLKIESIETLFHNANWLEREASEMTGIFFSNKLDSRNLLLMYGDVFYPLLKFFSSVGVYEYFYNIPNDVLIKTPISLQN